MPYSTTPPPSGGHAVSPYLTLFILVAGVVGGLVIVVAVIVFCKYCVKKDKPLQRVSTTEIRRQSDRERRFKPLQRYETINSDVFSEPSTGSMEGLPISPRKCYDTRSVERYSEVDEVTETTKLKTDFEKAGYNDTTEDNQETEANANAEDKNDGRQEIEKVGRRVSFQLDNLPPATSTYLRKGRRYTEGDFHHLKRSRIEKVVPRQYSLCTPSHLNVNNSPSPDHRPSQQFFSDDDVTRHAMMQYRPPLISLAESPSPPGEPSQTEVSVEIHYHINTDYNNRKSSLPKRRDSAKSSPLLGIGCSKRVRSHSHSLEVSTHKFYEQSRRTKSYEDIVDYDVLKITEFKGPFYNTDFDVISELGSPTGSKVRYNDTGSIEQLNDDNLDRLSLYDTYEDFEVDMENDDTETLNGTQKYRELWNLRTTFEEEEECSDTIRMEDTITSPDQSPDENSNYSDHVSYNNNNTGGNNRTERKRIHNHQSHNQIQIGSNTLHPHFENRRQTYQNILTKRLQRAKQNTSTENSFDSVETVDTDGDVSDTSRHEVTTTSFETSTDNTDSTTESQNHRLMQMKADSGYKSLENQPPIVQPPGAVKRNHSAGEIEEYDSFFQEPGPSGEHFYTRSKNFDRRNGKTASKKRREYSRERQAVQIYESINEPETDSRSDQPSGDSFEETPQPSKISVFSRLFKSQKGSTKQRSNTRDYSIDEKTDKLFREFVRYDPKFEHRSNTSPHRSPRFHRHRLHRKHTEPMYFEERRRDRLAPELRTTSLGSDSSASSARRISPQDSIEEEDYEEVREAEELEPSIIQRDLTSRQSLSVHDIPVIKLPEEEASAGF